MMSPRSRGGSKWPAASPRALGSLAIAGLLSLSLLGPATAGPPYLSDDPEPTDYKHFEIYTFSNGTVTQDRTNGEAGIDFNYGGAPNLQLTAVVPAGYVFPATGASTASLGKVELAAKYRFLTQDVAGIDVAIFPRVFLPSASSGVGEQHPALLVPFWLEKDWDKWSVFGGGGCELNQGGLSQNFCLMGAVLTRQVTPKLQLGLEIFHQTPDTIGGRPTTSLGLGARYDLSDNVHLLGYVNRGVQNVRQTDQFLWYTSALFTF